MSAELLREAAALMRELAEAASPDAWLPFLVPDRAAAHGGEWVVDSPATFICSTHVDDERGRADAEHIASWQPAVALAVADWLEATAAEHESDSGNSTVDAFFTSFDTAPDVAALAVASAYLGRES